MSFPNTLRSLVDHVEKTWPVEDRDELAAYARTIEERRTGLYALSPDEEEAVAEGLAQADRGDLVDDTVLAADRHRYGL